MRTTKVAMSMGLLVLTVAGVGLPESARGQQPSEGNRVSTSEPQWRAVHICLRAARDCPS